MSTHLFTARTYLLRNQRFDLMIASAIILLLVGWFAALIVSLTAITWQVYGLSGLVIEMATSVLMLAMADLGLRYARSITHTQRRAATSFGLFLLVMIGVLSVANYIITAAELGVFDDFDPLCLVLTASVLVGGIFAFIQVILGGFDSMLVAVDRECRDWAASECDRSHKLLVIATMARSEVDFDQQKLEAYALLGNVFEQVPRIVRLASGRSRWAGDDERVASHVRDIRLGLRLLADRIRAEHEDTYKEVAAVTEAWSSMTIEEWATDARQRCAEIPIPLITISPFRCFAVDCRWMVAMRYRRSIRWSVRIARALIAGTRWVVRIVGVERTLTGGLIILRKLFVS